MDMDGYTRKRGAALLHRTSLRHLHRRKKGQLLPATTLHFGFSHGHGYFQESCGTSRCEGSEGLPIMRFTLRLSKIDMAIQNDPQTAVGESKGSGLAYVM